MKKFVIVLTITLLTVLSPLTSVFAQPFYEGKIMKIIVSTKPGGNYDFYARMVAKVMQKHLPGSTIIVKNIPGAGHIIGTNTMYHSKPDGLTFGTFNRALVLAQVAGLKGVKFDLSKMSWLGSPASDIYSLITTKKFKTIDDLLKADVVRLASSGIGSQAHVTAELFIDMMKLNNVKIATGYSGGEAELAMMRGEVDGQFASWSSMEPFVEDGHGQPIMFIGKKQPKKLESIPLIMDVIKDEKFTPVINLLLSLNLLARPFAGPAGIPDDRHKTLIEAFSKTCADPEFIRTADKAGIPIDFTSGSEAMKLVNDMLKLSPDTINLIKEGYGTK